MRQFIPKWKPEGPICLHCGAPNPDRGDRCGNCGENPFSSPRLLSPNQLEIKLAINRRATSRGPRAHS